MDFAQQVELDIMERQKPMNAAMARGDSAVQQFYRGAAVLVTGGSGFLGKQLIEKLFRSCEIKKVYVLLRPKKGKTIEQRLTYMLKDPLYDTLRRMKPKFAESIVPVDGDVAELRVGLSDQDWNNITNEVNVIVHMAATVNFDEPLRRAGLINVRGTREMLALARRCAQLKVFVHISTAFVHATASRVNTELLEQFYPVPVPPAVLLDVLASVDDERLAGMTPALIKDWPNTYTFTKAMAEELVRTTAGDLPVCIVRPPLVINSYVEPTPGWIDSQTVMASPVGFLLGSGLGVLHTMLSDRDMEMTYAPVDYVNNAIIAAGWDSVHNRQLSADIPIYTVSSSPCHTKWGALCDNFRTEEFYRLNSPKLLWYPYMIETNNFLLFWLLTWLLHYIPGYVLDAVVSVLGVRPKGMPSLVKIFSKVYKLNMVYHYFLTNYWNFRDDRLAHMAARLSPADRAVFCCDVRHIDQRELFKATTVGLRRYIVKDGLQGSAGAYKKWQWLFYANLLFLALYAWLLWRLACLLRVCAVLVSTYATINY